MTLKNLDFAFVLRKLTTDFAKGLRTHNDIEVSSHSTLLLEENFIWLMFFSCQVKNKLLSRRGMFFCQISVKVIFEYEEIEVLVLDYFWPSYLRSMAFSIKLMLFLDKLEFYKESFKWQRGKKHVFLVFSDLETEIWKLLTKARFALLNSSRFMKNAKNFIISQKCDINAWNRYLRIFNL